MAATILVINTNRIARILSVIKAMVSSRVPVKSSPVGSSTATRSCFQCIGESKRAFITRSFTGTRVASTGRRRSERAFLGEGISRQGCTLRAFGDFYPNRGGVGSGDPRRTQHGILREHFVVHLGDEIILAVSIAAPHLPELYGIDRHENFLDEYLQTTEVGRGRQFLPWLLWDMPRIGVWNSSVAMMSGHRPAAGKDCPWPAELLPANLPEPAARIRSAARGLAWHLHRSPDSLEAPELPARGRWRRVPPKR